MWRSRNSGSQSEQRVTLGAVFYVMEEILVWGPNALYDLFNKHERDECQVRGTSFGSYRHERGPCLLGGTHQQDGFSSDESLVRAEPIV